jgi:hypothetical protein
MDIHAPDKPVHSFKDFALHIAIVTVGILIALGLDGIRETIHEHRLVRETRESFRHELEANREHMLDEGPRVTASYRQLDSLAADLPSLADHPDQVLARLQKVDNPFYFFSVSALQGALSAGALSHMPTDDALSLSWACEGARIYAGYQQRALDSEIRATAFWRAHPHPTPDQFAEGEERILIFARDEKTLANVAPQIMDNFNHAWAVASK